MIPIMAAIALFLMLYIGDFLLQTNEIAINKAKSLKHLCVHGVIIYLVTTAAFVLMLEGYWIATPAGLLYTILHCVQDWFIWRGFAKVIKITGWERGDPMHDKWFFTFLGGDQMLHMIVLFLTFYAARLMWVT